MIAIPETYTHVSVSEQYLKNVLFDCMFISVMFSIKIIINTCLPNEKLAEPTTLYGLVEDATMK